jgi:hypothetical protein
MRKKNTPFINILKDGNPTRISYINADQSSAFPNSISQNEEAYYYITYNTETSYSMFDRNNYVSPISLKTVTNTNGNNQIRIDQWDRINNATTDYPPWWIMIKNEWKTVTRNHVDQILIMDSINNINSNDLISILDSNCI